MPNFAALPLNLPPRLICREAAAAYVSVSAGMFDKMVETGLMPQPKRLGDRRKAWDVRELDDAIDRLPRYAATSEDDGSSGDSSWSDVDAA